jgi:hypothetical protein
MSRPLLKVALTIVALKAAFLGHFSWLVLTKNSEARPSHIIALLAMYHDGRHYERIATEGYQFDEENTGTYAFFPLFPAVLRAVRVLVDPGGGLRYEAAVLLLNAAASVIGGMLLFSVLRRIHGERVAWWSILFLFSAPMAGYFDMKYTESWLLLFLGLYLVLMTRGRLVPAAFAGLLGGLTRPQGLLLSLLALERGPSEKRRLVLYGITPILGFALYWAWVSIATGSPLALFRVQGHWGRYYSISAIGENDSWFDLLSLGVACLCALVGFWRLKRFELGFLVASIAMPVSTGSLLSFGRFTLLMYPVHVVLAKIGARGRDTGVAPHVAILSVLVTGRLLVNRMVAAGCFVG